MRSPVSRRGAPVVGRRLAIAWALGLVAAPPAWSAPPPALPQRNLVIEWRQLDESLAMAGQQGVQGNVVSTAGGGAALSGGVTLSTQRRDEQRTQSQQLRVLNGGRASVRVGHSVPLTWVQAAQAEPQAGAFNQPAAGAGVVQGLTWLEAGRQIVLQPRWPGGSQPAVVDVQVDSAALDAERPGMPAGTVGSALPVQSRSQTVTTVLAPLGQWVTIARTGGEQVVEQPGSVSTLSSGAQRQLMQIRVMVP
jgi:hypothetical protein